MKEYNNGKNLIEEFWKQTLSTQIGVLDAMVNAVDNLPKEMHGDCLGEMYKANAAFMTLYFRALEETGGHLVHTQSDVLRRYSDALKTGLSKMEPTDEFCEPKANES